MRSAQYDDQYATCLATDSTLRIYSETVAPEEITAVLNLEPTRFFKMGEPRGTSGRLNAFHGWFYSTKGLTESRDTRRHIDLIVEALVGKTEAVHSLQERGCRVDISSYWLSIGQGGPMLSPEQMVKLAELKIEVWWDVYFRGDDET
jgi:hypothetical protein